MRLAQLIDCLNFENEPVVDKDIDPERRVEKLAIEGGLYRNLTRNRQAPLFEPACENAFIDRFKQSRSEFAVYAYCLIDNDCGELIDCNHARPLCDLCFLCVSA
jgi:hypothetical protein